MNLTIERIILHNFKGLKHENLLLNNSNVTISGANGSGKSSIECGWYWLMADCSESLASNPAVFPLDMEEATPSIEVVAVVDDKHITLERRLTRTVKKSKVEGVADAVSFSSTYLVNSVEYGLRDFKQKIAEYGITDKFLTLSHPDMFLSGKKDEMRKVLFGMVSDITDYEVAMQMDGCAEAAELLKNYTFTEAQSMQNANLRKIREAYGKDGELLRSKIEGLEMSKADLNFSDLELQRNMLKEQLEKNRDAQEVGNSIEKELNELRSQNMTWQFKVSDLNSQLEQERKAREEKLSANKRAAQEKAFVLDNDIRRYTNEVDIHGNSIKRLTAEIEASEAKISEVEAEVLDEDSLYCSLCGQLLQFEKREDVRRNFEANKLKRIADLHTKIDESRSLLAIKRTEMAEITRKIEKATDDRKALETALNERVFAPQGASEESQRILRELNTAKAQLEAVNSLIETKQASMPNMNILKAEEMTIHNDLRNCEIQLSKADTNNEIDEKIAELRELQMKYEQNKADSEKVLYELSLIQKRKYDLITESINKHFRIVKWSFWEYQKNGEVKDVVVPKVNGKALGSDLNTAMCILAKLDIIQGLQNFYGEHYPVFLDGAEALDETSLSQIQMDCQMIYLKVSENKELIVSES